ncbi:MAG: restriction endonuclease subunit S, partial [Candidatus Electrothrix sp. AR4]|nr:restriction endonuclease subunit S [Candidatus Electrothrix sp. AR4]
MSMEELISKHLATWTGAQSTKAAGGRGRGRKRSGAQGHYGIKKLRELILELAVRGKLVPQDPADEPASVLLERIAAEKASLIKAGKIKKQKALPPIAAEEKPFELPAGWQFARFGKATFNRDFERIPLSVAERKERGGTYDYYGASGIIDSIDDYIFDKSLLLIGEDGANLINRSTPIAFMAHGKYWVNNHAHVLDGLTEDLLLYICLHINAISLEAYVTGTAQPKMNQAKMNSIVLALPPLAEQHRIVAKVDELMALCDRLEKHQTDSIATHQTLLTTLLDALTASADHAEFTATWQRISEHFDILFTTEQSIDQ